MHNQQTIHPGQEVIFDRSSNLKQRDFMGQLFKVGSAKCVEYLGQDKAVDRDSFLHCRNEIMVAASCVLLNKVNNQMGDNRDNVGLCKYEIKLAKEKLTEKFPEFPLKKMDEWFRELSLSTKSFV
jgi:hypothetical protein